MLKLIHSNLEFFKTSFLGLFAANVATQTAHIFDAKIKPLYEGIDLNNLVNSVTQIIILSITTYQLIKLANINKKNKK